METQVSREPIAEELFTGPDGDPALIGGRCTECEHFVFPLRGGCPYCGGTALERRELGREGTLWTWTSQGFVPKPPFAGQFTDPDNFRPWYVGLVEIPGELRVETLLVDVEEDDLRIGMPMRLVLTPFRKDEDGNEIVTFAFAPAVDAVTSTQEASHA